MIFISEKNPNQKPPDYKHVKQHFENGHWTIPKGLSFRTLYFEFKFVLNQTMIRFKSSSFAMIHLKRGQRPPQPPLHEGKQAQFF